MIVCFFVQLNRREQEVQELTAKCVALRKREAAVAQKERQLQQKQSLLAAREQELALYEENKKQQIAVRVVHRGETQNDIALSFLKRMMMMMMTFGLMFL